MQSELAMLRAEVRTLADQLKDAENLASSQVSCLYRPATAFTRDASKLCYTLDPVHRQMTTVVYRQSRVAQVKTHV